MLNPTTLSALAGERNQAKIHLEVFSAGSCKHRIAGPAPLKPARRVNSRQAKIHLEVMNAKCRITFQHGPNPAMLSCVRH